MPVIYSAPANITAIAGLSNSQVLNITDNNPYTSYQHTGGALTITYQGTIDTAYILAENIGTAANNNVFPDSSMIGVTKRGLIKGQTDGSVTVPAGKIYSIILMKKLLTLDQTDTRSITRFDTSRTFRNTYVQEDLYGRRSLQKGHLGGTKRTIAYTIWKRGSDMRQARNEINELLQIANDNPNITIWDLDENTYDLQDPTMPFDPVDNPRNDNNYDVNNYEGVFGAYWVPDSFSETLQGLQVVSYSFAVTEQ